MPKKDFTNYEMEEHKKELGKLIKICRGNTSLRKFTEGSILPHSNLQIIERGINAPTPEVYAFLIEKLKPDPEIRNEMDKHYMAIRNMPPPDVCRTITSTDGLIESFRLLDGATLSKNQAKELEELIKSFVKEIKGEIGND